MRITRRQVLAGGAAALAAPPARATGPIQELRAAPATSPIGPEGLAPTPVWAYGGTVPGPEIRVRQGDRVNRRLVNGLDQPTTIHWHGVRIANAMDGVPGLTQEAVAPGGSFDYGFEVPDAGTYWYHPHNRTWEQLARGLYGALVVEEPEPPEVDRDLVLLIDDWRLAEDGTIHESFGMMHDWAHAGRLGNWATVNGRGAHAETVRENERLRFRLGNAATARVFPLRFTGLAAHLVALDGMPLAMPAPVETLTLAPAQRADVIADVTAGEGAVARIVEPDQRGALALADFPVSGRARVQPLGPPRALPANPVAPLGDLGAARSVPLRMEGGAMRGLAEGTRRGGFGGAMDDMPAIWALAGTVGMPERPFLEAGRGETVRIAMVNDTAFPHAMHLHGHHFRMIDGRGPGPLRDTLLVAAGETAEVAFVADNPGDWMLHCHMVEHAASGMMTWLRVA